MPSATPLLLVSVGNTRTRYAYAIEGQLDPSVSRENSDLGGLLADLSGEAADVAQSSAAGSGEGRGVAGARVVIASVNDPVAERIQAHLTETGAQVFRAGRDLPIPIQNTLIPPITVGEDRLLNALAAYTRSKQACIVIDAGTAVTVDFVDGAGVFHGGAIAPGVRMMLVAMHEKTAALPAVDLRPDLLPQEGEPPFGKTTPQAMAVGAVAAARGLAHTLIDRYADFYQAYPRVIATGGDAPLLFDGDELVEHIVPDLTLIGLMAACELVMDAVESED
ncbi:MAG: type III pantothenate kinase [Phycisphaeraceae bacterium]|nr:type III pantothenate kinase [Phycisphaeraceae bacterium]